MTRSRFEREPGDYGVKAFKDFSDSERQQILEKLHTHLLNVLKLTETQDIELEDFISSVEGKHYQEIFNEMLEKLERDRNSGRMDWRYLLEDDTFKNDTVSAKSVADQLRWLINTVNWWSGAQRPVSD